MVQDGRNCSEVFIQIAAVKLAVNNIGLIILQDHIKHCVTDATAIGDTKVLEGLSVAIEKFVK